MRRLVIAAILASAIAIPADSATRFRARNGLFVVPETARTFSVPFTISGDDNDFWCAAGDFVQRGLGLPGRTPIFRVTPPPRRQAQGIRFSLDAAGAAARTGVSIFSNSGPANSVSASIARNLCPDFFPRFRRF